MIFSLNAQKIPLDISELINAKSETSFNCKFFIVQERGNLIVYMQHEFLIVHYHMPTTCDTCPKPLWHMFKAPDALECRSKLSIVVKRNVL